MIQSYELQVVPWRRLTQPIPFWPPAKKYSFRFSSRNGGGASGSADTRVADDFFPLEDDEGEDAEATIHEEELQALMEELLALASFIPEAQNPSAHASAASPAAKAASVPPPPEAGVLPKGRGRGRGAGKGAPRYDHYDVTAEDGQVIGYLLHNTNASQFDIHCNLHGGDCAIGRSYLPYAGIVGAGATAMRLAKGRPLAFLVAWLRWGQQFVDADGRHRHMNARVCQGLDAPLGDGGSWERLSARAYVEAEAAFVGLRLVERQPRDGEPIEPRGKL